MQMPILNLPRPVPPERERQPQDSIPQTRAERERMKLQARHLSPHSSARVRTRDTATRG